MTPGQHVYARRTLKGLTAVQVAARGGPSKSTLSLIENDRWGRSASPRTAPTKLALARLLKWPPPAYDWLVEGDDPSWWEAEAVDGGTRWTRRRPGEQDAPMVVTEIHDLGDFLGMPGEEGQVADVAAQSGRMALERTKEVHEEVIRLKIRVEDVESRLMLLEGRPTRAEPAVLAPGLAIAAQGGRKPESEAGMLSELDQVRKKQSPRKG